MLKTNLKIADIFSAIFVPIWRSFIFTGISVFSFLILTILSTLNISTAIIAAIIFVPFSLLILFVLYLAATAISKEIEKINNQILKFISYKIIPPVVFFLIGQFSSAVKEEDKLYYYLSIPLSFLIIYFFDRVIRFLGSPKK